MKNRDNLLGQSGQIYTKNNMHTPCTPRMSIKQNENNMFSLIFMYDIEIFISVPDLDVKCCIRSDKKPYENFWPSISTFPAHRIQFIITACRQCSIFFWLQLCLDICHQNVHVMWWQVMSVGSIKDIYCLCVCVCNKK